MNEIKKKLEIMKNSIHKTVKKRKEEKTSEVNVNIYIYK